MIFYLVQFLPWFFLLFLLLSSLGLYKVTFNWGVLSSWVVNRSITSNVTCNAIYSALFVYNRYTRIVFFHFAHKRIINVCTNCTTTTHICVMWTLGKTPPLPVSWFPISFLSVFAYRFCKLIIPEFALILLFRAGSLFWKDTKIHKNSN